jgi:hypothetical protein
MSREVWDKFTGKVDLIAGMICDLTDDLFFVLIR